MTKIFQFTNSNQSQITVIFEEEITIHTSSRIMEKVLIYKEKNSGIIIYYNCLDCERTYFYVNKQQEYQYCDFPGGIVYSGHVYNLLSPNQWESFKDILEQYSYDKD